MKNKIKIAFFDIDGTLIDMNRKKISEKTVEALARLKENGVILCIATGRGPFGLPHFEGIEFDAFLTFNGSYCFQKQQDIFSNPILKEDAKQIIQNAAFINRPVSIATRNRLISNGTDCDLEEYYSFANMKVTVSDDFEKVLNEERIYQLLVSCRESERETLMKNVRQAKITSWWDGAVDIIPKDGGKGVGIERILSYYHLDRSEAIAFGDGNNDIEMLQTVGFGVAMENASEELKAVAADVCGHVKDEGIYDYCLEHGLI